MGCAASLRDRMVAAAPAVRRYLFGMCGRWHEAEDLAQEALLKAWAKRAGFDGRASVQTWLMAIARNCWLSQLRRRRVRPWEKTMSDQAQQRVLEAGTGTAGSGPAEAAASSELSGAVAAAMAKLPDEQREALALRESGAMTFAQIGELLGIPAATVKSRVRYALTKLAQRLRPFRKEYGT